MEKTGLVLEGGGMRGAYTAGAVAWLSDNNIKFDYNVGISSGAVHLCSYLMNNTKALYDVSVTYMSDKNNVGVKALLREGRWVGYKYIFNVQLKEKVKYTTKSIKEAKTNMEFGVYDLNQSKTIYFNASDLDDDLIMLQAACTLPIAGNVVHINGHRLLDGGITDMVPIERSIENKCTRHLVITTKPEGYVRKKSGKMMNLFMKMNYLHDPKMVHDYSIRYLNYNKQMNLIYDLVDKGEAMLIRPSMTVDVARFSGDPENLKKLYELGYSDMENNKERIKQFLCLK